MDSNDLNLQISQITLNAGCRLRNLPGSIPRSLLRQDRIYHTLMLRGLPRGRSFQMVFHVGIYGNEGRGLFADFIKGVDRIRDFMPQADHPGGRQDHVV